MRELRFVPATDLIIDIFSCDETSDAEVIAAAKAIEEQRLNHPNKSAQIGATSQSNTASKPGPSRA